MPTITQGFLTGEWLISEAPGDRSRSNGTVTVAGGVALPSGTVLGQITVGTTAVAAAVAGNTGNGTMGAVTLSAGAKAGVYRLVVIEPGTNLGVFTVEDPDGISIGRGTVGTAFSAGGLGFTLADGATDFAAGDQFTITVAAGSLKWVRYAAGNTDGSQIARAVLLNALPGVNGDYQAVVFDTDCEVIGSVLNGGAGLDANGIANLTARGFKVR